MTDLQWIASEAWTEAILLQTPHLMPYLGGTLGIAIRQGEIPGLKEFLLQIRPDQKDNGNYVNNMVSAILQIDLKLFTYTCIYVYVCMRVCLHVCVCVCVNLSTYQTVYLDIVTHSPTGDSQANRRHFGGPLFVLP